MNYHVKELLKGFGLLFFAFSTATLISAHILKPNVDRAMSELESGIMKYSEKSTRCKIHGEFGFQALYVLSDPFRDFTNFKKTNELCEKFL